MSRCGSRLGFGARHLAAERKHDDGVEQDVGDDRPARTSGYDDARASRVQDAPRCVIARLPVYDARSSATRCMPILGDVDAAPLDVVERAGLLEVIPERVDRRRCRAPAPRGCTCVTPSLNSGRTPVSITSFGQRRLELVEAAASTRTCAARSARWLPSPAAATSGQLLLIEPAADLRGFAGAVRRPRRRVALDRRVQLGLVARQPDDADDLPRGDGEHQHRDDRRPPRARRARCRTDGWRDWCAASRRPAPAGRRRRRAPARRAARRRR